MDATQTATPERGGRLAGRLALVLGAGSGIGRAVVAAYRNEGAAVVALEIDDAKCAALRAELPSVEVVRGDACRRADIEVAAGACAARGGGRFDALVNCVGVFDFYRPLADIDAGQLEAAFDEIFHVNVLSSLIATRVCLPQLRAGRGTVILTSSSSGFYPGRGGVLYVASKFAARGCVTALASELAPHVRVNGVAPGGVLGTDLRGAAALGLDRQRLRADADRIDDLRRLSPLEVALTPADIAGTYVFLASTAALGMTGEFLHPDGGMGVRG